MHSFCRSLVGCFALIFALGPPLAGAEPQPDEIVISGVVIDEWGDPVEGATAEVVAARNSRLAALELWRRIHPHGNTAKEPVPDPVRSGADGRFVLSLEGEAAAKLRRQGHEYSLRLSHGQFFSIDALLAPLKSSGQCGPTNEQALAPLGRLELPTATLPAEGSEIEVSVLDPFGEPAAGAWIRVWQEDSEGAWQPAERLAPVDASGKTRVVQPGARKDGTHASISAYLPGFAPAELPLREDEFGVTLHLKEAELQDLRVTWNDGRSANFARVLLHPGHWPVGTTGSLGLVTIHRSPGESTIEILEPTRRDLVHLPALALRGESHLSARVSGAESTVDLMGNPTDLDATHLRGTLRSAQGQPIPGAFVMLQNLDAGDDRSGGTVFSGPTGFFSFADLHLEAAGRWQLMFVGPVGLVVPLPGLPTAPLHLTVPQQVPREISCD